MSFNIVALWPRCIVCASDRRVTGFSNGEIRTNRSTKMTLFACADAYGAIMYNGIGSDDAGQTPSDWVLQLAERKDFGNIAMPELLDDVAGDLENRLKPLRARYGPKVARHSFVFGVWQNGKPSIYMISNYESAEDGYEAPEGSDCVKQSVAKPTPEKPIQICSTGAHPSIAQFRAISETIKTASLQAVQSRVVKTVREIAYGKQKAKGSVGSAAQWTVLGATVGEVFVGSDVAGGAITQETPNQINIAAEVPGSGTVRIRMGGLGMLIKGAWIGGDQAKRPGHYDPARKMFVFDEVRCGICSAPWPASHRFCEVCLYDRTASEHGSRRRSDGQFVRYDVRFLVVSAAVV